ncbi:hypothetical protein [Inquilinus limosus]|uniref:hypothetical protein n=1 Tax=Inquilinus limosus TaxID=171674 RepID=UPI0013787A45|nr:hypothetical protein [Inquilinus limosus]
MIKQLLISFPLFLMGSSALADVLKFECLFDRRWSPDGIASDNFSMVFNYDSLANKAFMVGNVGVEEVYPIRGYQGLSFIEVLQTGAVQTTTISNEGAAVHSRNSMIGGEFVPSQYGGTCRITR